MRQFFLSINMCSYVCQKIRSTHFMPHCKHIPCSTLTHSTNEDLLNIKRKGDPKSRTLSPTSDTTETRNPCVIKVIAIKSSLAYNNVQYIYNTCALLKHIDNMCMRLRNGGKGEALPSLFPRFNRTYKCKTGHIVGYCFRIHTQNYFKYFYHRPVNVYLRFKIAFLSINMCSYVCQKIRSTHFMPLRARWHIIMSNIYTILVHC
jgi:hypothetical protein